MEKKQKYVTWIQITDKVHIKTEDIYVDIAKIKIEKDSRMCTIKQRL